MSNPFPRWRCGLLAFAALPLLAFFALRVLAEEYRSPSDGIQLMRYENEQGLLSLEVKDASLDKVLTNLARIAKITFVSDGPIEGRITVYADRLPLDKALRKILRGRDTSFVYAAEDDTSPSQYAVKEVRIYVAKPEQGEGRRYSYESQKRDEAPRPSRSPPRPLWSNRNQPRSPAVTTSPRIPNIGSSQDAKRLLTELIEGDLDELDEIAERLKEANPQVEEQIDEFLDSLEEAKTRAEESGRPMEGLGQMQMLMQQILKKGEMPSEEGP